MANAEMETFGEMNRAWKTTARKLVWFFKASRDKWKAKYGQQMKKNKLLYTAILRRPLPGLEPADHSWQDGASPARPPKPTIHACR